MDTASGLPAIHTELAELIGEIYQFTLDTSSKWIEAGQQGEVIPASI
jgi:hypothetical protein